MKKLYREVTEWFSKNMPVAESELDFDSPFQLLVAVILSAQCTDKRVNMVTPAIFARYSTPQAMASATFDDLFALIKSISYPNSKTTHLIGMAQMLVDEFDSVVPSDIDQLQRLPGVGRKTANVVASIVYNKPVIAVDTHVFRVANRLGLSNGKTPLEVEKDLTAGFPAELRGRAHHWLILHGRYVCVARAPKCSECGLSSLCPHFRKQSL
ncbi:MAG: endonuclease III [Bacteroidales bacterium]|nr:endonuclease III [Bacteroidales bacterium]